MLLDAIRFAILGDIGRLNQVLELIEDDHQAAASQAISGGTEEMLAKVQREISNDCEMLRCVLKATSTLGEISENTTDRVLAVGETLACRIVTAALQSKGIFAEVVILDDIVERSYGKDHRDLLSKFGQHPTAFLRGLTNAIAQKIDPCTGIPVITGFFGVMPGSLIKTISRGYSDLCAALCAIALDAQELQIWKEVDGIFTADPRKIKSARLLKTITSEEAAELTYYGSEVIHPLTIEQIVQAEITIRLKNVTNPNGDGTVIYPSYRPLSPSPLSGRKSAERPLTQNFNVSKTIAKNNFMTTNGYYGPNLSRRTPTAITVKEGVIVLNIHSHGSTSSQAFLYQISSILQKQCIVVDLISSTQQTLSLAVCSPETHSLQQAIEEVQRFGIVSTMDQMSIVSVIGHNMRNMVGIGLEIFSALASARVNIYLISQGASEINISFVVKAQNAQLAMQVVHTNVMRIPQHAEQENAFAKGPWLY